PSPTVSPLLPPPGTIPKPPSPSTPGFTTPSSPVVTSPPVALASSLHKSPPPFLVLPQVQLHHLHHLR
ncbi:hypothetical protein Leryth_003562, partial [Lithospermum erythrorhizon]